MERKPLTAEFLRSVLHYDQETGAFTWVKTLSNAAVAGSIAGSPTVDGYWEIGLLNRSHRAHRLAWLYVHGEQPNGIIDHINGDTRDNRICNLRVVSPQQSCWNTKGHRDSVTGFKGVQVHRNRAKPYQARIHLNGSCKSLGYFATAEEAHSAYCNAAAEHFGSFARFAP